MSRSPRSWFDDRPITVKVLAAVCACAVVAVVVGVVGLVALARSASISDQLAEDNIAGLQQVDDAVTSLNQMRLNVRNAVIAPTDTAATEAAAGIEEHHRAFLDTLEGYSGTTLTAEQEDLLDQAVATMAEYRAFVDEDLQPLADAGDLDGWFTTNDDSGLGAEIDSVITDLRRSEVQLAATQADAARASYESQRLTSIVVLTAGVALAVAIAVVVARRLARQVGQVQGVAEGLARGDLTVSSGLTSTDEVGRMAAALDAAVLDLRGVMASVIASSDAVASSSEELSASSAQISAAAEETSAQSGVVSAAADEVSRSVATAAAGAEQMGASIREIAQNTTEAARVASQAVGVAATANATVTKLGTSSKEIGDVVKTITSIAEQTNLLALNATIEAARAGEAGKGFAVVANEVKELAQETARATEDISRRVATIQADTTGAVAAIDEISAIIASINDFQTTIASAVEEQTATTNEMSRSVSEAAGGSTEIAANITGVSTAAQSTTQALSQTRVAVGELATLAADLRSQVARFTS